MALADRIFDTTQIPTFDVRVNGVPILPSNPTSNDGVPGVVAIRGQESFDSPVPTIDLEVTRIPTWMRRGMPVTIDAGYSLEHTRLFTGGVLALGDEDPEYLRTQCFAVGATDEDGATIEATASAIDHPPIWPPVPAGQFIDFSIDNHLVHDLPKLAEVASRELSRALRIPRRPSGDLVRRTVQCVGDLYGAYRAYNIPARDLSGQTVEAAIAGVLTDSGIASYTLSVPAYTLAAEDATLERMPGAQMLDKLMQIDGCKVQQLPSGIVVVSVVEEQPAESAAFAYSTNDQATARIVDDTGELQVPFNPLLRIGQTIQLDIEYLNISGRFWLRGHRWEISEAGAWSYLDLQGGDDFGGTVGINPIAAFTVSVAKQVIGDDLYFVITVTDASFDLDGEIDQAASSWTCNHTTIPDISDFDGQPVATVRIAVDDVTPPFEITRIVVDNDALQHTASVTQELDLSGSLAVVPPIAVAAGTTRMVTPDGGANWNDTTPAAKTATAVGARLADGTIAGHFAFGHSDGSIDLTTDFGQTVVAALAAVGSQFNDVAWDWRDRSLVWALTDNCKLYLSNNFGVSFFLLADLRTVTFGGFGGTAPGALGNIIGLPAGGGVHIFGGDGAGRPMHVFNTNPFGGQPWLRVTFTGDLLTDTTPVADATMRIVGYAAPGYGGETMILSWASGGAATLVAIYHTNDAIGLSRSFTRATGLTAGLKNGRVIMESGPLSPVSRIAMFGDDDTWQSADGIAYTQIADNLPAGFTPNHGLFASSVLAPMSAIYEHFLAVEDATGTGGVMKSTDEGLTWSFLRPATGFPAWPAGAKAKKIALGAPGESATTFGARLLIAIQPTSVSDIYEAHRTEPLGDWSNQLVNATYQQGAWVRALTSSVHVIVMRGPAGSTTEIATDDDFDSTVAYRTKDARVTWAELARPNANDAWQDFCIDGGGRIWGVTIDEAASPDVTKAWYSDDDMDTWTLSQQFAAIAPGGTLNGRGYWRIRAHPTNPNIIVTYGGEIAAGGTHKHRTATTTNRGEDWTERVDPARSGRNKHLSFDFVITSGGRLVLTSINQDGETCIDTTDDWGLTWTERQNFGDSTTNDNRILGPVGTRLGDKLFVVEVTETATPDTSKPWQSLDAGLSWEEFTNSVAGALASDHARGGIAYDEAIDALFVLMRNADAGPPVTGGVFKMAPVTVDGEWEDITGALPDFIVDNYSQQIAVIP